MNILNKALQVIKVFFKKKTYPPYPIEFNQYTGAIIMSDGTKLNPADVIRKSEIMGVEPPTIELWGNLYRPFKADRYYDRGEIVYIKKPGYENRRHCLEHYQYTK